MKLPIILALFASWIAAAFSSAAEKPNFIYILADDLGYGDLGCYGQSTLATPNLDRMAAEGMRFTRHYAGSTVCAPSRCVLLTGKHTGHCSVRGNGPAQMKPGEPTVALALKAAGYRTACIGKWGVGNPPPPTDPNDRGFDYFYGYANMYHAHNCFPEFLIRNGEKVPLGNVVADKWKGGDGRGVAVQRRVRARSLHGGGARLHRAEQGRSVFSISRSTSHTPTTKAEKTAWRCQTSAGVRGEGTGASRRIHCIAMRRSTASAPSLPS
ncbi:MAG: sulfatase-like hydrolase/transferase [Verrucomicrobiales bacterium]